jgi:hypothetical protein
MTDLSMNKDRIPYNILIMELKSGRLNWRPISRRAQEAMKEWWKEQHGKTEVIGHAELLITHMQWVHKGRWWIPSDTISWLQITWFYWLLVTGCGDLQGCQMLRIPHCLDNWLTDGNEVVSLMHWPCSTPGNIFISVCGTYSCYRLSKLPGLVHWQKSFTSSGFKPATFWLVQCGNIIQRFNAINTKAHQWRWSWTSSPSQNSHNLFL